MAKDRNQQRSHNQCQQGRDGKTDTPQKTDYASNQQKDAAWRSLAEKFNSDAVVYRNVKQLQQKFNNMKKIARKEISAEKNSRKQTGGGPPPPKPSETTEWLSTIMGESISGLPTVYDSDVIGIYVRMKRVFSFDIDLFVL